MSWNLSGVLALNPNFSIHTPTTSPPPFPGPKAADIFTCAVSEQVYHFKQGQVIFEQPNCRIGNLVDAGIAKRQTASVYLKKLAEIGVLQEQQAGREKIFINPKLMQLLDRPDNDFLPYTRPGTLG